MLDSAEAAAVVTATGAGVAAVSGLAASKSVAGRRQGGSGAVREEVDLTGIIRLLTSATATMVEPVTSMWVVRQSAD